MKNLSRLKLILVPLCLGMLLKISGCTWSPPPVQTTKKVVLSLSALYLSSGGYFCSAQYQGTKSIKVTIAVDNINLYSGSVSSNFKTYVFNVTNTDTDKANTEFENIEVPTSGSFSISVTSEAAVCYTCCYNNDGKCRTVGGGIPYYKGVSTVYSTSSSPTFVQVVPRYANCL